MPARFEDTSVAVIGLGYVGLPLALALARHFPVTGFDIKTDRVQELKDGYDRTDEADPEALKSSSLSYSATAADIQGKDIYIVTVPTPVDEETHTPDLTPLRKASETVGKALKKGAIVVYESTVYPGITEEFCAPLLEQHSGLTCGTDFFLGYSPERINPGDKEHTLERITKVVAGQTPEVLTLLVKLYGSINKGNIHAAPTIKTAEAAKVIENAQRDINIAFINEITTIMHRAGISIYDVLAAANTKWNFLPFQPGLVGGHCIGVDPYYLADFAQKMGHQPKVILSGREINESMGATIADALHATLRAKGHTNATILMMGLTFKEDVPDLRNSKVIDLYHHLTHHGHTVHIHDPLADAAEAKALYGISLLQDLPQHAPYDCLLGAVRHHSYREMTAPQLSALLHPTQGIIADIKNMWRTLNWPTETGYWSL